MRRRTALLLASVLGVVAAVGGATLREASSPEPSAVQAADRERGAGPTVVSDRIDDAVAGLATSHLWVAPELADRVDAPTREAVERELAEAPVPTYLVLWTESTEAGYGTTQYDALDAMLPRLGSASTPARLSLVTQDRTSLVGNIGEDTTYADQDLLGGRLGPGLERYAEALAAEESEPPSEPSTSSDADGFNLAGGDYYGGLLGGGVLGVLLGGGIALVLIILVLIVAAAIRSARPLEDR